MTPIHAYTLRTSSWPVVVVGHDLLKIQQERECDFFKIQQERERESDLLKIQQESDELFKIQQEAISGALGC